MLCPCDFGTQPAQRLEGIAAGMQGRTLSAGFVRAGKLPKDKKWGSFAEFTESRNK